MHAGKISSSAEDFEAVGLQDFFGDSADGKIDWDTFFNSKILLDLQMPSFIRGDEDEDASNLF